MGPISQRQILTMLPSIFIHGIVLGVAVPSQTSKEVDKERRGGLVVGFDTFTAFAWAAACCRFVQRKNIMSVACACAVQRPGAGDKRGAQDQAAVFGGGFAGESHQAVRKTARTAYHSPPVTDSPQDARAKALQHALAEEQVCRWGKGGACPVGSCLFTFGMMLLTVLQVQVKCGEKVAEAQVEAQALQAGRHVIRTWCIILTH